MPSDPTSVLWAVDTPSDLRKIEIVDIQITSAGKLGLDLVPLTVQLLAGTTKTMSFKACVVKESKNVMPGFKTGDVLVSVGEHLLMAEETRSPSGLAHVRACVKVLTDASEPLPRTVRVFRSDSVDVALETCSLRADESMDLAPLILNGETRQRLATLRLFSVLLLSYQCHSLLTFLYCLVGVLGQTAKVLGA